jgi:hypothetical protein
MSVLWRYEQNSSSIIHILDYICLHVADNVQSNSLTSPILGRPNINVFTYKSKIQYSVSRLAPQSLVFFGKQLQSNVCCCSASGLPSAYSCLQQKMIADVFIQTVLV